MDEGRLSRKLFRVRRLLTADEMREINHCHCGKKATMVIRQDENGAVIKDGAQIQIGGNETYVSLCRRHWREAIGDFDKI